MVLGRKGIGLPFAIRGVAVIALIAVFLFAFPEKLNESVRQATEGLPEMFGLAGERVDMTKCTSEDLATESREENIVLTRELASEGVPPDIVLRIMNVESGFVHCRDGNVVLDNVLGESIGIGQIHYETAGQTCPDLNVFLKADNIKCSYKVTASKVPIAENTTRYNAGVDKNCNATIHPERNTLYKSYTNKWDRVYRLYNGLGCDERTANICYVHEVKNETCPLA